MSIKIKIVFIILFQFLFFNVFSQVDTTEIIENKIDSVYDVSDDSLSIDNILVTDSLSKKNPRKAFWMSFFVPGLGQAYNGKFWKIPVFYTAYGTFIYQQQFNNRRYRKYLTALVAETDDNENTVNVTGETDLEKLEFFRKKYRRNRDLFLLLIVATHLLNFIDASVDAHLYDFDISEDLTIKLRPSILQTHTYETAYGISLSIKF